MILDRTGLLSENQAITASAASTNIKDRGTPGTVYGTNAPLMGDLGRGTPTPFYVGVTEAFNNLASLTISVQTADDAAFTTNLTTAYTSPAYGPADLVPGARHLVPDEIPVGTNRRYIRMYYTVVGAAPTMGRITAGVVMSRQTNNGKY